MRNGQQMNMSSRVSLSQFFSPHFQYLAQLFVVICLERLLLFVRKIERNSKEIDEVNVEID